MGIWHLKGGRRWYDGKLQDNDVFSIVVENDPMIRNIHLQPEDIITSGLYDLHCHVQGICPTWAGVNNILGLGAEAYLFDGVFGLADAGSYGYDHWKESDQLWQMSRVQIRSWLNVLPEGLTQTEPNHTLATDIDLNRLVQTYQDANGRLLGYKYMHGLSGGDPDVELDWLRKVKQASRVVGAPVMVHLTGGALSVETIISELDAGDILAHIYNGAGPGGLILDHTGHVRPIVREAARKGILFELDAGFKHINFDVFRQALAEGVKPHFIATDTTCNNWKILPVYSMAHFLSEVIQLGLDVETTLQCAIDRPRAYMGIKDDPDKNLVVLKKRVHATVFQDNIADKNEFIGEWEYIPKYCVLGNQAVRKNEF